MKPNTFCLIFLFSVLSFFIAELSWSSEVKEGNPPKKSSKFFDIDGDGNIDQGEEQRRLVLDIINPSFQQLDVNKNGIIENKDLDQAFEDPSLPMGAKSESEITPNRLRDLSSDLDRYRAAQGGELGVEKIDKKYYSQSSPKSPKKDGILGLRLRESLEDNTIVDLKKLKDSKPADFSLVQDFKEDDSEITVNAAVFRPFKVETENVTTTGRPTLTAYQISPGIAVSRAKTDERHTFRLGLNTDFEVQSNGIFKSQYFRGNLIYKTDAAFDSDIINANLQWEPVRTNWGLGRAVKVLGSPIKTRWRGRIQAELDQVLDAGDLENASTGDFSARIGPRASIEFFPDPQISSDFLKRFKLTTEYAFLQDISGDDKTRDFLDSQLTFRLDDTGNSELKLKYFLGRKEVEQDRVNKFTAGFGFRY